MSRTDNVPKAAFSPSAFVELLQAMHAPDAVPNLLVSYRTIESGSQQGEPVITLQTAGIVSAIPFDYAGEIRDKIARQAAKTGCEVCAHLALALAEIMASIEAAGHGGATIH